MTITKDDITGCETSEKWQTLDGWPIKIFDVEGGIVMYAYKAPGKRWVVAEAGCRNETAFVPIPPKRKPLVGRILMGNYEVGLGTFYSDYGPLPSNGIPVREYDPAGS